ncbi:fatty acid synthase-like [Saccostrea echinata]|uniref:fatty acid synthase-like n=1 Tax=Saccostrea echinata TaxID=191078 RepID=UPI002A80E19A|nr:fatty acid synthase-like [Saccostrea echinata]
MYETFLAGVASRLPESENIDEFWENLILGKDLIRGTRWPRELHGTPPRVGLIKNIDKFDAEYFNFEENEVHHMNPMLRHLYEVCSECVVDSGLSLSVLQNNTTGIYLACFLPDSDALETSREAISKLCTTVPMMAGHLMEYFGFSGPMMTVDTGCSSSLSALEMAVSDLNAGKCQFAMVTGANLLLNPSYFQQMMQLGMLNPSGHSNVFDAKAGGYVRAEGVVAVLLTRNVTICKRVYLSISDILTNCDGFKSEGITFPNSQSQAKLMSTIYSRDDIDVNDIAYVEAHSTGTKAGDPVEANGIVQALCEGRHKPLLVGSVKASMGHSEATAGLASLVKCIMIARHGTIPPQINYDSQNPKIDGITQGKIKVVDQAMPLADGYISLNSFGYGGANGHAVLKPFRKQHTINKDVSHSLVTIHTRNEREMESVVDFVRKNRKNVSSLALLSNSWLSSDPRRPIRGYIIAEHHNNGVSHKVSKHISLVPSIWLLLRDVAFEKLALSSILIENPIFRRSIQTSQKILNKMDETFQLTQMLTIGPAACQINERIVLAISSLIGLVDTITEANVPVQGVVGCGLSEIVAGYKDGCLNREQCVRLAYLIGEQIEKCSKTDLHGRYSVYKTTLNPEDIYCLGPFTRVLSVIAQDIFVIAVDNKYKDEVLRTIHEKGGYYLELKDRLPLYSEWMDGLIDGIEEQAQEIINSPKCRSKNMVSLSQDYAYGCQSNVKSLFDWDYLRRVLITPVTVTSLMATLPVDTSLVDINFSRLTDPKRLEKHFVFDPIPCNGDLKSVLKMLGEIHLLGHDVSAQCLYDVSFPLDASAPSLSPLVKWNHSESWLIPEWPEFYCRVKDDVEVPYTISDLETEGIHSKQGVLLYHALIAINEKHNKTHELTSGMELLNMVWTVDEIDQEDIDSTDSIHVQTGKKSFVVEKGEIVLLSGEYRIYEPEEKVILPKIPGYDLDVNENLKGGDEDRVFMQKTEITWEDSWLDFLDTLLEFSMQWLEGPLFRMWVDPSSHMKKIKDCANLLAVLEGSTGLCKAGDLVLHTKGSQLKNKDKEKAVNLSGIESSKVSLLMLYTIESVAAGSHRVLMYQGENAKEQVNGIISITDREIVGQEFPLSMGWTPEDLEQLIPYILAVHLLLDVARIKENQTLLIMPPIDTLCIYLMAIANELEVSIFTSSFDAEIRNVISNLFPYVRVVAGERLEQNIKTLTQGEGCDVVIKFTSADFQSAINLTSANGKLICCTLPSPREEVVLTKDCSLIVPDLSKAVNSYIQKSPQEIQLYLYNMQNGSVAEMSREGFPEVQGLKYVLADRSNFTCPVELTQVLSIIEDPIVNLSNQGIAEMMEADAIAMHRLQTAITTKPKDFLLLANDSSDKENQFDSFNPLNIAQVPTPTPSSAEARDEIKLIYLPEVDLQDYDEVFHMAADERIIPPLRTPIITITDETDTGSKVITSTPMHGLAADQRENPGLAKMFPTPKEPKGRMAQLTIPRLTIPSAISSFKKGAKMSLIVYPTPTPLTFTPALKTLLTPQTSEPTIVPLNDEKKQPALFCIHPITGKLKLLKTLGSLLQYQCYGIQRTHITPQDSIPSVASYYKNAVQMYQENDPYFLVGYSFGSFIAIEMAIQFQEQGSKIGCLILLDGGPSYFHNQFSHGIQAASKEEDMDYLECGALINFLQMYAAVPSSKLILQILLSLKTLSERIDLILDMTFGRVVVSPNPAKSRWLIAKEKLKMKGLMTPTRMYGFSDAAEELVRLKRKEAAKDFVTSVKIGYKYRSTGQKFKGDIHLLRIKSDLPLPNPIPMDYGLKDWCTGNVNVRFYNGTHESFLNDVDGKAVAKDIMEIVTGC